MPYANKTKAVCFACRKTFISYDRDRGDPIATEQIDVRGITRRALWYAPMPLPCPQCDARMWDAGMHFKTPRHSDVKQWEKVRVLAAHGFRFANARCCGWFGPGKRPDTLKEVPAFVAARVSVSAAHVSAEAEIALGSYKK